jgi:hypothetical protein
MAQTRSAIAFRPERSNGRLDDPDALRNTPSRWVNFVSLSGIRNLIARERSASTKLRLRTCWVTHSPNRIGGDTGEVDPPGVDLDRPVGVLKRKKKWTKRAFAKDP